jgi:hypothetical protein
MDSQCLYVAMPLDELKTRSEIFMKILSIVVSKKAMQDPYMINQLTCSLESMLFAEAPSLSEYSDEKTLPARVEDAFKRFTSNDKLTRQMIIHATCISILERKD